MQERLVQEALDEVQSAANSARRARGERELDLVGLGNDLPEAVRQNAERMARDRQLGAVATVATVGLRLREERANDRALPFLEAAGELKDAMAANTAGLALLDLGRDRGQAYEWFLKSARAGDSQAQYNLGCLYFDDGELAPSENWLGLSSDPRAAELLASIKAEAPRPAPPARRGEFGFSSRPRGMA